jgi:Class II flagellar assembly regulator
MQIEGTGKSSSVKGAGKTEKKKGASGASFGSLVETGEAEATAGASGPSPVARLDALLSIQEAGDGASSPSAGKQAAQRRAGMLLDELDKVRMGLLVGGVPESALKNISRLAAQHRETIMDPALTELLDEIDLRAQVELAKLGR